MRLRWRGSLSRRNTSEWNYGRNARGFINLILPREHQEQDDAQLEKQARDIVEGKKRVKRRGFDLGSDESGSEDEDADRRRRKSIKKPRFDDGKLEGIGSFIVISTSLRFPLTSCPQAEMSIPVPS